MIEVIPETLLNRSRSCSIAFTLSGQLTSKRHIIGLSCVWDYYVLLHFRWENLALISIQVPSQSLLLRFSLLLCGMLGALTGDLVNQLERGQSLDH